MSKEKQIEEMNNAVRERIHDKECSMTKVYEALYDAGYRKQVEGQWISTKIPTGVEAYGIREVQIYPKCSMCGYMVDVSEWHFNYCPNCGAKMKGGVE